MQHKIRDTAALPMVWNDGENTWEIDVEQIRGPLAPAEMIGDQVPGCPCIDEHGGETSIEHDEAWGRAVAIPFPTADDVALMLGFSMIKAGRMPVEDAAHPRTPSPELEKMVRGMIRNHVSKVTHGERLVDELAAELLVVFASVDENAHRRGEAACHAGVKA
jgi:hypothetical protein